MTKRQKQVLLVTIIFSVILRVAAAIYMGNRVDTLPGIFDQVSYHNLALRLLGGHGFTFDKPWWPVTAANAPTAHWSYLYTAFLYAVYAIFGPFPIVARVIQAILSGLLQPFLAYKLGQQIFGPAAGIAAAILSGFYTYFIYYSAALMTESFYIISILASFWIALMLVDSPFKSSRIEGNRGKIKIALLLSLVLGITVLLRQLFLLFIPFLFFGIWWINQKRQLSWLILSSIVIIVLILPFTFYNYIRFNRFVLLNTNAGYAFFWANHPIYGTHFEPILPASKGTYQDLIPAELRHLDEAALDQALLVRGLKFVIDDPVRYILLSLSRIPAYFLFWPLKDSSLISNIARATSFGLLWPFMLYGLWLSFLENPKPILQSPKLLFYLFIVIYTGIHLLTWTLVRYRLPVDAILLIFSGLAIINLMARIPKLHLLVRALS